MIAASIYALQRSAAMSSARRTNSPLLFMWRLRESMTLDQLRCQSCLRRSLMTISTICGTVSTRAQSRCSSQASETQLIGLAPA
jgi:hypothetical protein